jgi:histidinol-phosphate aminotransferase
VNDRTRLVFIAAPNSPTGTMVSRAELEEFFAAMQRQKVIVLLDEAYREFVDDPDSPQGRDFIDRECPAVVLRTFSKIYGLAGLRVGYGLGPKWLIELLNRVRPPFNVNALAQIAATAALEDHEHKEKSKRLARDGIAYLTEELTKLGLRVAPSQANFVCFFLPCDAHDVYVSMLKKGVIVRKLDSFGLPDAIRVTVGLREHNERFVKALIGALDEHKISGVG